MKTGSVQSEPIYVERFVAAVPPGHRLAAESAIDSDKFAGENVLLLEDGNCMRKQTEAICRRLRGNRGESFEVNGIESLRQMVSGGIGCSLMPYLATVGPFADTVPVAYRQLGENPPTRTLVLAWRHRFPFATELRRMAKMLKSELPARIKT